MINNTVSPAVDKNVMTLKHRFLAAVAAGKLGTFSDQGVIVTSKEFKSHFSDIKTQYITSFLPCSTIEIGQHSATRTRFVFRLKKGVYRVHPDAVEEHVREFGLCMRRNPVNDTME